MTKASMLGKLGIVAVAGLTLTAAVAVPTDADAQWRRSRGGAVAAGIVGGLAVGALLAGAARPAYGYYPYSYGSYGGYAPGFYGGYSPAYYGAYPPYYGAYTPAFYGPRFYGPTVYAPRRRIARFYAGSFCTVRRQRVWVGPGTYTVRRVQICR